MYNQSGIKEALMFWKKGFFLIFSFIILFSLFACTWTSQISKTQPTITHTPTIKPAAPVPINPTATGNPPSPTLPPPASPVPIATLPPTLLVPSVAPISVVVTDSKVIYHGGIEENGTWVYYTDSENYVDPWLDLLVKLGDIWYGPERQLNDSINALALPPEYHWECERGFACKTGGEAWWTGQWNDGMARLFGPNGMKILELSLKVVFKSSGGGEDGFLFKVEVEPSYMGR
jgi:hypothetical protein